MKVKTLLAMILLVLVAWVGINAVRGKALFSNPFAEKTFSEKAHDAIDEAFGR